MAIRQTARVTLNESGEVDHETRRPTLVAKAPPCGRRWRRLRWPPCREGPSEGRRRRHARRPHEPPPLSAAALPGRDGILSEGQIAPPLRGILRKHKNVHVELAEVTGFDLENRTVAAVRPLGTAITFPYDSLIVATGATTSYFGRDELAQHSIPMKTIDDALNLRRRIFAAFELAETAPSEAERRRWLTFAVVGGGPTGCEVAGQIAELARRTLEHDFRAIDPTSAVVLLVEANKQILRNFGNRPVPEGHERARAHGSRDPHRDARDQHRR